MSNNSRFGEDQEDLALARAVRDLDRDIAPERDLWAGIERKIGQFPQKKESRWKQDWMPYGVAASMLIAVTSLLLNMVQLQPVNSQPVSFDQSMEKMKSEYHQVINPMVQQFGEVNKTLDPATLQELYRNIEIIEQARKDIEAQLKKNPDNPKLVEMLMWIHGQEVELLKRDFAYPIRTI